MTISDFIQYLKANIPSTKFYNNSINKLETECVGVYSKEGVSPHVALGKLGSFSYFPVRILVHWSENADTCEQKAQSIYDLLFNANNPLVGGKRAIDFTMLDSCPVFVGRDDDNIVEMVIRLTIIYER